MLTGGDSGRFGRQGTVLCLLFPWGKGDTEPSLVSSELMPRPACRKGGDIIKDLHLTPVELFFLARVMNARYVEYAYISAMPDIQIGFGKHERDTLETLEERGLIEEDFSGNTEVDEEAADLLHPVFFGERETHLDNGSAYYFHIEGSKITMAEKREGEYVFSRTDEVGIRSLLSDHDAQITFGDIVRNGRKDDYTAEQLKDEAVLAQAVSLLMGG